MTRLSGVSGIVLAGGRSRRFGRDKLAEPVGDRPLLQLAVEAVGRVSPDVVVVAAPGADLDLPGHVRLVHDEAAHGGPLAGCHAGLIAAREPLTIVVGGDMPALQSSILVLLLRTLDASAVDASVLEYLGRAQPLPIALRTGTGTEMARRLLAERERRLGALVEHLIVRFVPEGEWRPLDPEAQTLLDIDEEADLDRVRESPGLNGPRPGSDRPGGS